MDPESPPRDLELSALEAEKEPMAAAAEPEPEPEPDPEPEPEPGSPPRAPGPAPGGEKNGLVLKIPPEEEEEAAALGGAGGSGGPKFTGLGKEELLREAGTPLWARARLLLLLLFWGGWLGMLGAAAAIVAQAPRCQPLPSKSWWDLGALYRAPPRAFGGDLKGVEKRLGYLKEKLQVGGLVLGPVYPQKPAGAKIPSLKELDPALGTVQDFTALVETAKDKGLKVILDLTPNPSGGPVWGDAANDSEVHQQVKAALSHWLKQDIAGIFLDGIEELQPSVVAEWRNLTEQQPSPSGVDRLLVGGTRLPEPWRALGAPGGPRLLLGPFLRPLEPHPELEAPGAALGDLLDFLNSSSSSSSSSSGLGWSVGSPWESWVNPKLRLQQLLLLWGLPGTPVLSYGDEVALERSPKMLPMPWELIEGLEKGGNDSEAAAALELCRGLSQLRARERSLLLGGARALRAGPAVALLRYWDQNERFLLVLNPHGYELKPFSAKRGSGEPALPPQVTLRYSTGPGLPGEQQLQLEQLRLGPFEGALLSFPYSPL